MTRTRLFDGNKARKFREQLGLSPTEAAANVGVTAETLRRWELGSNTPDANRVAALARAYNVTISDFFSSAKLVRGRTGAA